MIPRHLALTRLKVLLSLKLVDSTEIALVKFLVSEKELHSDFVILVEVVDNRVILSKLLALLAIRLSQVDYNL